MTNSQRTLFQSMPFDSLYDPTATFNFRCAEVVSRSFQITPVPIKATSSNLMHPRTGEDDINKLGLTSEYNNVWVCGRERGREGKRKYFLPLNGAVNNHFSAEGWSHKADGGFVV